MPGIKRVGSKKMLAAKQRSLGLPNAVLIGLIAARSLFGEAACRTLVLYCVDLLRVYNLANFMSH